MFISDSVEDLSIFVAALSWWKSESELFSQNYNINYL